MPPGQWWTISGSISSCHYEPKQGSWHLWMSPQILFPCKIHQCLKDHTHCLLHLPRPRDLNTSQSHGEKMVNACLVLLQALSDLLLQLHSFVGKLCYKTQIHSSWSSQSDLKKKTCTVAHLWTGLIVWFVYCRGRRPRGQLSSTLALEMFKDSVPVGPHSLARGGTQV